jgi:hypothetical protein
LKKKILYAQQRKYNLHSGKTILLLRKEMTLNILAYCDGFAQGIAGQ